jgi:hypothetical protein
MRIPSQLTLTLALAVTNASAATHYRIDFDLQRGGTTFSSPSIVVDEGREAEIIVEPTDEREPDVRIVATTRAEAPTRDGVATVRLQMAVYEKRAGAWAVLGEPTIVIVPERYASLRLTRVDETNSARALDLGIVVRSVSARGGD